MVPWIFTSSFLENYLGSSQALSLVRSFQTDLFQTIVAFGGSGVRLRNMTSKWHGALEPLSTLSTLNWLTFGSIDGDALQLGRIFLGTLISLLNPLYKFSFLYSLGRVPYANLLNFDVWNFYGIRYLPFLFFGGLSFFEGILKLLRVVVKERFDLYICLVLFLCKVRGSFWALITK